MKKLHLLAMMASLVGVTPNVQPTGMRKRKMNSRKRDKNGHDSFRYGSSRGALGARQRAVGIHWIRK